MPPRHLFTLQGLNKWILGLGLAANLLWAFFILSGTFLGLAASSGRLATLLQLGLLLASFGGPFLIGWLLGALAADGRGPSYGLISTLSAILLAAFVLLPVGIYGVMIVLTLPLGGLNGGMYAERRNIRK
jgi:uncharacterized membrane protein